MLQNAFTLLDNADKNTGMLFTELQSIVTLTANNLDQLDELLAQGHSKEHYPILLIPYEFGQDLLNLSSSDTPLHVYWYAKKTDLQDVKTWLESYIDTNQPIGITNLTLDTSEEQYKRHIQAIHEAIRRGETYQVNYTIKTTFRSLGSPLALYHQLRQAQAAPYAAFHCLEDGRFLLSLSPERFFNIKDSVIRCLPMKGTAPIQIDDFDGANAKQLSQDVKNRAENTMIVDLMRNDLGRIAECGSVTVNDLFAVRPYGKVWQMTSEVQATLEQVKYSEILKALFPCGSITGAPKRKTMEIISQLESSPRNFYTGSLGYIDAQGNSSFNILIRTLLLEGDQGMMGVGSGITIDSTAQGEYDECHWKTAFLQAIKPNLQLFETFKVIDQQAPLIKQHLQRLRSSALSMGFLFPDEIADAIHLKLAGAPKCLMRGKITLNSQGRFEIELHEMTPTHVPVGYLISPIYLSNKDALRCFKTNYREVYDLGWQQAVQVGGFDMLFFNEAGYLLEGGRTSVFAQIKGEWRTPDISLDILPGIQRQEILNNPLRYLGVKSIDTRPISREEFAQAEKVILCNALRGLMPAYRL